MILHAFATFLGYGPTEEVEKLIEDASYSVLDENSQQVVAAFKGMLLISANEFGIARRGCYDVIVRWTDAFGNRWNKFARQVYLCAAIAQLAVDKSKSDSLLDEFQHLFDFQSSPETLMQDLYNSLKTLCDSMKHRDLESSSFFECFLAVASRVSGDDEMEKRHWTEMRKHFEKGERAFENIIQRWEKPERYDLSNELKPSGLLNKRARKSNGA